MPHPHLALDGRLRLAALRRLDRFFPPEPAARMDAAAQTSRERQKARGSMGRYLDEIGRRDIDVLDFGCGWGGETMWLAERVRSVVGVDVERSSIEHARAALAGSGIANCRFEWSAGGRLPLADASVDAALSTDTFEHVMDLDLAFSEILRVLRPGGCLVTRFGPLFYSPYGYHMRWACQVPWAHVLFGLQPVLVLRNERASTTEPLQVRSWRETGVNGRRFVEFRAAAERAGFTLRRFEPIPVGGARPLARIPWVRDFFIFGIDCVAQRPDAGRTD